MIGKLDHFYLETRHYDRAREFWADLGFSSESEWGEDGHRACQLRSGEAMLVLAEAESQDSCEGPTVVFSVDDPEAVNTRLADSPAVDVTTPLEDTHWGTRWIRVRDPDGNVFNLEARPS